MRVFCNVTSSALWKCAIAIIACVALGSGLLMLTSPEPDPGVLFSNAVESLNQGDQKPAVSAVNQLSKLPDFSQHAMLLQGGIALKSGDLLRALEHFRSVQPEGLLKAQTLLWTGECLYRLGKLKYAINCFSDLAKASPGSVEAHRWLAAVYFDLGAMDLALSHLARVVEVDSNDFRAYRLAGTIYYDFEKWPEASEQFQKAFDSPQPAHERQRSGIDLGRALIKLGNHAQASSVCKQIKPTSKVLCMLAECAWVLEGAPSGLQLLSKAIDVDPNYASAHLLQARIHLEAGQPEKTITPLRNFVDSNPYDFDAQFMLTTALRQLGRNDEADVQFQQQEKARIAREQMATLNQQAILNPFDSQIRLDLATLCRQTGQTELADIWAKAAEGCDNSGLPSTTRVSVPAGSQIEF
jgi:tetratricopeptide (TPR) repeat protein